jgi:phage-related minor tail protein
MAGKSSTINVKILGDNKGLAKSLDDSSGRLGKFAAGAATAFAAAGIGAAVGLAKLGSSFDKEYDKIRVGTGATGEQLAGLQDSFKNVLKDVPTSFGDAGSAIADLNTRLGLTGKPLEDLSAQFINLSRISGTDLTGNVDKITRVFGDWEIATGDQAASMDALYRASQASGIGLEELSGSVVSFGAPLRNLGFGFDESLALLAQFNKTGVNTETVFAGLKAGVGKLAKEGEPIPETFRRIVDEITALGPGSEATGLAIELFGQRAGPDLADAIAGGKFEIEDMLGAITDGTDTINGAAKDTESFGEKWTKIKNRVLVGLEPLATKVFDKIGEAMDAIGPYVDDIQKWLEKNIPKAIEAIQKAWKKWGQPTFDAIKTGIEAVVGFVTENWPKVQDAIGTTFQWIKDNRDVVLGALGGLGVLVAAVVVPAFVGWAVAAGAAALATIAAAAPFIALGAALAAVGAAAVWAYQNVDWFREAVDTVVSFFRDTVWPILQATYDTIVEVISGIVETVRENWDTIKTIITTVFDEVWRYVENIWDTIYGVVSSYIEIIRGVIKTVTALIKGDWSGVWDGIKQILQGVWDGIKAIVSGAIDAVKQGLGLALAAIRLAWEAAWNGISSFVSGIWDGIVGFVEGGINDLMGFITALPGRVVSAVSGAFDGIKDAFKSAINWVIDAINSIKLPGVTIGGWDPPGPGPTIPSFTTPSIDPFPYIPRLHTGGVVPGPYGQEQVTVLQAGERVTPMDADNAAAASGPDWNAIAREMAREYSRTMRQEMRAA